jgi:hypothetical protein
MKKVDDLLKEALSAMEWAGVCTEKGGLCDDIRAFQKAKKEFLSLHGNAEDLWVEQVDYLNCPHCAGSGHIEGVPDGTSKDVPEPDFGNIEVIGQLHPNGLFEGPMPMHLPFPIKLYAKPYPRKPMTDFREYFEEMHSQLQEDYGDNASIFEAGFKEGARWVQLDHGPFKRHQVIGGE